VFASESFAYYNVVVIAVGERFVSTLWHLASKLIVKFLAETLVPSGA
jgi:hypothetical protein